MTDSPAADSESTYFAFVSYSHKDEKWAKWIQDALEGYRLPAAVRKEAGKSLPKRIRPVFRDATDLGVGKLADNLRRELEQSRFLIVVCSPHSAQPNEQGKHWVEQEVERFCELRRADRIIPVIVGGTAETAYCPKLADLNILGLDATKLPRERILNDLVATILGLRPDELWRREERRRRARRRGRLLGAALAAAVLAFGGFLAWDATRTVANYYADYVDSFGLPEGIFPLEETELSNRHHHYRFEYRGVQIANSPHADSAKRSVWNALGLRRRLVRVVQANSKGYPFILEDSDHGGQVDRPRIQDFAYAGSRLREIRQESFNGDGQEPNLERRTELYNDKGTVNGLLKFFSHEDQRSLAYDMTSATMSKGLGQEKAKSEIMQHSLQRDSRGRVLKRLFLNSSFFNVSDGNGVFGFSYEHDDLGRETAQWHLGREHGNTIRTSGMKGVAGEKRIYSGADLQITEYVDANGIPVFGPDGWMIHERRHDDAGNVTGGRFLDAGGLEIPCADGYAEYRCEYDGCGNKTQESYFGTDRKPAWHKDGYGMKGFEYDEQGKLKKLSFFDLAGKPTLHKKGHAAEHYAYDDRGKMTRLLFSGLDGKPTRTSDGYAEMRWEYDERGNSTRIAIFGADGRPTVHLKGNAEIRCEYDERGNLIKKSYFGVDGNPVLRTDGFAEIRWEYDERGNKKKQSYFGVDGKPTLQTDGYAEVRWEYDGRGNTTKASYFGVDGNPVLLTDGYAVVRWEYDGQGNTAKESYFGVNGKPTSQTGGYAEVRWEHDGRGNTTKESYYGVDGKRTLLPEGYAEIRWEYDGQGNTAKESYFGVGGKPTSQTGGYAEVRWEYDGRGNTTKKAYFGVDGEPMLNTDYAEVRWEYDGRGNKVKESYFGVDGKPTLLMDGYAEVRWESDGGGNLVKESYFGLDGKLTSNSDGYAEVHWEYDGRGNQVKEAYFGVDGKPRINSLGFAEIRWEYDEFGNFLGAILSDIPDEQLQPSDSGSD